MTAPLKTAAEARRDLADLTSGRVAFFNHGLAVLDPIEPGYSVRAPTAPVLAASAVEAVTDHPAYTNEQASVVVADSDRIDLDLMEHERQSRLSRWQDQRQ